MSKSKKFLNSKVKRKNMLFGNARRHRVSGLQQGETRQVAEFKGSSQHSPEAQLEELLTDVYPLAMVLAQSIFCSGHQFDSALPGQN
jgi:hypothetical protein